MHLYTHCATIKTNDISIKECECSKMEDEFSIIDADLITKTFESMNKGDKADLVKAYRKEFPEKINDVELKVDAFLQYAVELDKNSLLKVMDLVERESYKSHAALFQVNTTLSLNNLMESFNPYMSDTQKLSTLGTNKLYFNKVDNEMKINVRLDGAVLAEGQAKAVAYKYPIFLRFFYYKDQIFLELSLDSVKRSLQDGSSFYIRMIDSVVEWLTTILALDLMPIALDNVITTIDDSHEKIYRSGQKMELASGAKATLDSGLDDDKYTMPILGGLRSLIQENDGLFTKSDDTIEIKKILNSFITDTEENSNLPWISVTWDNETKSKIVKVKFEFSSETNEEYTHLYFYDNKLGREGMINVSDLLVEKYCESIENNEIPDATVE